MFSFSKSGEILLNNFEGFIPHPYQDVKGVWTIGYGTTTYPSGKKVGPKDAPITKEQAIQYRDFFISTWILPVLEAEISVTITQNQVDALVSFIYNIGPGAFETSHLLQKINSNATCKEIRDEFAKWRKSGGKVIDALVKRRAKEANLYC